MMATRVITIQTYRKPFVGIATGAEPWPADDLTARARIRDAATAQFADRGFRAATIRSIADAAGVSPGLVQHHYGTKERLRAACDEAAVERVRRQLEVIVHADREVTSPDFASALYASSPLLVRYLIRLLLEGGPAATTLFDVMAAGTERFLSDAAPDLFPPGSRHALEGATMMTVMHLGAATLRGQVERRTGASLDDPTSAPRLGLVILDVYAAMSRWLLSETGIQVRAAVARRYLDGLGASGDPARSATEHHKDHDDD
jgi:TetR/AcrR family transcriptional regulator, regulator of cefoperazone and chloramphenicol sensitivity